MMNDSMMKGGSMTYADAPRPGGSAVAVKCGPGMKECDGRCIPGGATCQSTAAAEEKKKKFHKGAKIAAAAGAAGVAAVGIRNRKVIGQAVKEGVERNKASAKVRADSAKELHEAKAADRKSRKAVAKARKGNFLQKAAAGFGAAGSTKRLQKVKEQRKGHGPLSGLGHAVSQIGKGVASNIGKDVSRPFREKEDK